MNYMAIGDMAQTFQMRNHNTQLKTTISRLNEEVVTGLQQDRGKAVAGDFTTLSGIERSLSLLNSYKIVTTEADLMTATMQNSLDVVHEMATDTGALLISASTNNTNELVNAQVGSAAIKFESVVAALNTNVTGRYVFSGAASDNKPLMEPDEILAALSTEVAGATSASDAIAKIDAWFDAGRGAGGFLDTAYQGSDEPIATYRIADGETAQVKISAGDAEIRDTLKGFAMTALLANGLYDGDLAARSAITAAAGERIMEGGQSLTELQTKLGTLQGKISDAATRNTAESSALQIARTDLLGADPYESVTALQAVQDQLQTLYTLTSRLSKLSMADYI